jgi:DNA-binding response OmpR family regulator
VKPTKVLFIEDSAGDAILVKQILTKPPFPVQLSIARDGEQALTILADPNFDAALIIIDLDLPKVSGHLVLDRNPRKDIPVVIFSASSAPLDIQLAKELGASQYFVKPSDIQEYQDAVLNIIKTLAATKDEEDAANGATAS